MILFAIQSVTCRDYAEGVSCEYKRLSGEMYEHSMNEEESQYAYEIDDMFIVLPQSMSSEYVLETARRAGHKKYTSDTVKICTTTDIEKLFQMMFL